MMSRTFVAGCLASSLIACGGNGDAKRVEHTGRPLERGVAGSEVPLCDFVGRDDRIAAVSLALGAEQPNVRRVYEIDPGLPNANKTLRCREVDSNFDGVTDLVRTYNEEGQMLGERADADYDGVIDTWLTFARSRVVEAKLDRDGDGRPDEFREYVAGRLVKVRRDTNGDGQIDTWEVYEDGRLNRIGIDNDGDEKVDRWYRDRELMLAEEAEAAAEAQANDGANAR